MSIQSQMSIEHTRGDSYTTRYLIIDTQLHSAGYIVTWCLDIFSSISFIILIVYCYSRFQNLKRNRYFMCYNLLSLEFQNTSFKENSATSSRNTAVSCAIYDCIYVIECV